MIIMTMIWNISMDICMDIFIMVHKTAKDITIMERIPMDIVMIMESMGKQSMHIYMMGCIIMMRYQHMSIYMKKIIRTHIYTEA